MGREIRLRVLHLKPSHSMIARASSHVRPLPIGPLADQDTVIGPRAPSWLHGHTTNGALNIGQAPLRQKAVSIRPPQLVVIIWSFNLEAVCILSYMYHTVFGTKKPKMEPEVSGQNTEWITRAAESLLPWCLCISDSQRPFKGSLIPWPWVAWSNFKTFFKVFDVG